MISNKSKRNEVSFYPEIEQFISTQIKSNLLANGVSDIEVYWKIGELTTKLHELIREHPEKCSCMKSFADNTPPLNLDVFGVVTNGVRFQIIVLEIKLLRNAGLSEWSQLLGYCIVSDARYGLLININGGASQRLKGILITNNDVSHVVRKKSNGKEVECFAGFMQWNSLTRNFEYSNLGQLRSLSALSDFLVRDFTDKRPQ